MSTAARYLSGPRAQIVAHWDYDRDAPLTCPVCGWSGCGDGHENLFTELLDVTCPECDQMLLVVPHATPAETRAAAEAGNRRAQEALSYFEAAESHWQRAEKLMLKDPALARRPDWAFRAPFDRHDWPADWPAVAVSPLLSGFLCGLENRFGSPSVFSADSGNLQRIRVGRNPSRGRAKSAR